MNQKKFERLMKEILKFRDKRDWAQFYDLKNCAKLKALFRKVILKDFVLFSETKGVI